MTLKNEYGPLVLIPGILGRPTTLFCTNPDDFPTVFRNEGIWPNRRPLDVLSYHREVYRADFFKGVEGVVNTNGEKWSEVRSMVNPILMQPKNAKLYLKNMLEVSDEFIARIRDIRDPNTQEMPDTFHDEINRLTLETVCSISLNTQFGLIRKNRESPEAVSIIHNVRRFFDLLYELDFMPSLWKIVGTPKFYEMMRILDELLNVCKKSIDETIAKIESNSDLTASMDGKEKSVLEKLLKLDKKVAIVTAFDMINAGVDTTSTAITGILLCLAKNPEKQQKLFEELKTILPTKDSLLTIENMQNLPYLRACIKEALRIYPVVTGTIRKLPVDVVLSGYQVPKETDIVLVGNFLLANYEELVPNHKEFIPERWLRESETPALNNPMMYIPFGFGARACVGKRIVNMEMEINIARMVRNFIVEYNYPTENAFVLKMVSSPNIPLKFKFEERNL